MADWQKRLPTNVDGDFFVDVTCIDCDTCRHLAPATFAEVGEQSAVVHQPDSENQRREATRALLACPTGSIGDRGESMIKAVQADFPLPIDWHTPDPHATGIYTCGYTSPKSYGATSYFIRHPEGNWLIDSPRFVTPLVSRLEALGGVRRIFLSHQDDVADSAAYAQHFGAEHIIHQTEAHAAPGAEHLISGMAPVAFGPDFRVIPTPGHSRGHCVLLYRNRFLFTGDHLAWRRESGSLTAFRDYCWDSWPDQIDSMRRLLVYDQVTWVLPGHGQAIHLPATEMHQHLRTLVEKMPQF